MKRCCIFSRVSSIYQSADEQTKELCAEANRNGYTDDDIIIIEWTESAIKLDESDRESIQRLYRVIDENPIECVICRELSRIARRPDVLYSVRDTLINKKIQLIVCHPYMQLLDNNGKLSQTASIMFSIFTSIAESEMAIKIERFREGKLRKKHAGKWAGGFLPFGYKFDPKTHDIYVDEEQARIIRQIFDMYVNQNMSTVKIARYFNKTGELNCCKDGRTMDTAVSTIGSYLKNKAYIGEHPMYRGKRVENIYERIVSDDLFYRAAVKLDSHNSRKNTTIDIASKHIYYCKDILVDIYGNKLIGKSVANAYRYVRVDISGSRYQITVPINMVDSIVWHYTKEYLEIHDTLTNADAIRTAKKEQSLLIKTIETDRKKNENYNNQILKINERIVSGKMKEVVGDAMLSKIEQQIDDLKNEIIVKTIELVSVEKRIAILQDKTIKPLENTDDETRDELIHKYVQKIEVKPTGEWGEYELSIIFYDMYINFATIKSMSKKAYDVLGHEIQFEYLERFVRPEKK